MTQVTFWENVASVVTNFAKEQVSFETAGPRLYLAPLVPEISGELFIVLTTGQPVTLAVLEDADHRDLAVQVLAPAAEAEQARAATAEVTALRLLRAMLLGRPAAGIAVTAGRGEVAYDDGTVRLTLAAVWRTPGLEGIVLDAENLRPLWIRLPLERLELPGLLAVHAAAEALAPPPTTPEERLAARHRTRLYLVRIPQPGARATPVAPPAPAAAPTPKAPSTEAPAGSAKEGA